MTKKTTAPRITRLCSIGIMIAALLVGYIIAHLQIQSFHNNLLARPEDMLVFWPYLVAIGGACLVTSRYIRRQRYAIAMAVLAIGLCVAVYGLFGAGVTYFDYYDGPRVPVPWMWIGLGGVVLLCCGLYRHQHDREEQ